MGILRSKPIIYTPDSLKQTNSLFVFAKSDIVAYLWKIGIIFANNILTVPGYESLDLAENGLNNTEIYFTRGDDNSCLICGKDADGYWESMIYPFFYKNEKRISEEDMIEYGLLSHQDIVHQYTTDQVK